MARFKVKSIGFAGRPYGHVPGHSYLDVEVLRAGRGYRLLIVWGSAQGSDEEHGREEYARGTLDALRDAALEAHIGAGEHEVRRYIETACERAALVLAEAGL